MTLKNFLLTLLYIIAISIGLLIVATLGDIILTVTSTLEIAPLCFAVAGVFAGSLCYSLAMEKAPKEKRKQVSFYIVIMIAVISILLFYPVAPLSGSEYKLAFKCFAATQLLMAVFLCKQKFYENE